MAASGGWKRGWGPQGNTILGTFVRSEFSATNLVHFCIACVGFHFLKMKNKISLGRSGEQRELVQGLPVLSEETDPLTTVLLGPHTRGGRPRPGGPSTLRAPLPAGPRGGTANSLSVAFPWSPPSPRAPTRTPGVGTGGSPLQKHLCRSQGQALNSCPMGAQRVLGALSPFSLGTGL